MYENKNGIPHRIEKQKFLTKSAPWKLICIISALLISCAAFSACNSENPTTPETTSKETSTIIETQSSEVTSSDDVNTDTTETVTDVTSDVTEEITTEEITTEEITEDKDMYKNETKLFSRSVMLSANELEGEFTSLVYNKNGGLVLADGATSGTFTSGEINMGGSFSKMVTSWNSSSTGGTVEISVAVKLDDGSFTDWYSWGEWSAILGVSGSKTKSDSNGKINVDILTLTKECQGIIKFKIDIKQTTDHSPILYNVTFACNKANSALTAPSDEAIKLDVPYRRQQDVPEIGGSICSATSLSMVMLYHGEEIPDIADVAWAVRDYKDEIFGNWAFNVAHAGERGYNAYVDFFDVNDIKYAVSTGHPIVCSIKVTRGQLAASGFRSYSTNGHLICIVGYEQRDGKTWLLVNDPAHPEVTALLESDFVNVYRGVSYIVQTRPEISANN